MRSLSAAVLALAVAISAPAAADPPDAEDVRKAASAFDDGSRDYRAGNFELAASNFEAADAAVPSARALRMAIRARTQAGQPGRASTLGELALVRYPDDEKTSALARKTIKVNRRGLHRLKISCAKSCLLAEGVRSVPGKAARKRVLWIPPGRRTIAASFADGGGSDQQVIMAKAGGKNSLSFLPEKSAEPKPVAGPGSPKMPTPAQPEPAEPRPSGPADEDLYLEDMGDGESTWIEHPAVFVVSLVLTAGAGGVLTWSGIDTLQNPGTDVVREECAGKGQSCAEYQQGLQSQLRTNILIGATAGLGVVTGIIGIFVTDWGGDDDDVDADLSPEVGVAVTPDGAWMTWRGSF